MRPDDLRRSPSRPVRGWLARGVLVAGLLAGAVALQLASPAWQSRLDTLAATLGIAAPAAGAAAKPAHPSLVAGSGAAAASSGLTPAI